MDSPEEYIRVYTGYEVNLQHLQALFEEEQISSWVRNDFDSGLKAGFGGGVPGQAQLFVPRHQASQALQIIKEAFPEAS